MDLLFTKNPILRSMENHCIDDFYVDCLRRADNINIATGFITNDSIAELSRILTVHNFGLSINLLIGMHYIDGFTQLQYNSIRRLNEVLTARNAGNIYLSVNALFHGKMYSFTRNNECIGAFIGSSNLGSFLGTSSSMIEADAVFHNNEAKVVDSKIKDVIRILGTPFASAPEITAFKEPEQKIFVNNPNVIENSLVKQNYINKCVMDLLSGFR